MKAPPVVSNVFKARILAIIFYLNIRQPHDIWSLEAYRLTEDLFIFVVIFG